MRLNDTLKALGRRWYLVILGVAVTAGACFFIYEQIPVKYEAQGSLVLMPPSATVGDEGNPYLFLGGMGQALDVLTRHVNAAEVAEPVLEDHPDTSYTVEPDRATSGPIIQVSAVGLTPDATMSVLHAALQTVPVSLDAMQDEVSIEDRLRIGLMTVVIDTEATKDDKQRLQLLIFAAAGGLVGTVLVTGMIDGLVVAARKRKIDRAAALLDDDALDDDDLIGLTGAPVRKSSSSGASSDRPRRERVPADRSTSVETGRDTNPRPKRKGSTDKNPLQGVGAPR